MARYVLDASAVLALLLKERGHERVEEVVLGAESCIASVNLGEVAGDLALRGMPGALIHRVLALLRLSVVPVDEDLAVEAGLGSPQARVRGLSLGDRVCLALARRLGATALTTERAWLAWCGPVQVECIR